MVDALEVAHCLDRTGCRAAVEDRFSMQRMASDHADAYRALLEDGRIGDAEIADLLRGESTTGPGDLVGASG